MNANKNRLIVMKGREESVYEVDMNVMHLGYNSNFLNL